MEEEKKKNTNDYIVMIIGIALIVVGLCILFITGKNINKDPKPVDEGNKQQEEQENNNEQKKEDIPNDFTDVTNSLDNVYINGEKVDIRIETDEENEYHKMLVVNDKIAVDFSFNDTIKVYTIDDVIIVDLQYAMSWVFEHLYYINKSGDVIKDIGEKNGGIELWITDITPVNDYMKVMGYAFSDGPCEMAKDMQEEEGVSDDYIVQASYMVRYKNGNVEISVIPGSETTIKEFRETECADYDYDN